MADTERFADMLAISAMNATDRQENLLREAFRHQGTLTGYAYSMLRDWPLAEDMVQEALLEANRKLESFDDTRPIFPWVKGILRFKCLEAIRARKKESLYGDTELLDLMDQRLTQFMDEAFSSNRERQLHAIKHCMTKLNHQSLTLVNGFYHERRSCDELANTLGRTVNAVYIALTRIRQRLKKCSTQYLEMEIAE